VRRHGTPSLASLSLSDREGGGREHMLMHEHTRLVSGTLPSGRGDQPSNPFSATCFPRWLTSREAGGTGGGG